MQPLFIFCIYYLKPLNSYFMERCLPSLLPVNPYFWGGEERNYKTSLKSVGKYPDFLFIQRNRT